MPLLLLVEDNDDLAPGIAQALEEAGHAVDVAVDDADGVDKALTLKPDLIVLDLTQPGMPGSDVLKKMRLVSLTEVLARISAHQRRAGTIGGSEEPVVFRFGDIVVTPGARTASRGGRQVPLTPLEYDLLLEFLERPSIVLSRVHLLKEVWAQKPDVQTRTVDLHVSELRRKLEPDPALPRHFITVWKAGYRFEP